MRNLKSRTGVAMTAAVALVGMMFLTALDASADWEDHSGDLPGMDDSSSTLLVAGAVVVAALVVAVVVLSGGDEDEKEDSSMTEDPVEEIDPWDVDEYGCSNYSDRAGKRGSSTH